MQYLHKPVLLKETISFLALSPGQTVIDGTLGEGGHALEILKAIVPDRQKKGGKLLAIDFDSETIKRAQKRLESYKEHVVYEHNSFVHLKEIVVQLEDISDIHGIFLDLGLSRYQLKESGKGFSFEQDEPLDMRLDRSQSLAASDIVNSWSEDKLIWIFQEYGQEPFSKYIAAEICRVRRRIKFSTTRQLTEAVLLAIRTRLRSKKEIPWVGGLHPATRVFQALRIAVNDELENIKRVIPQAIDLLSPGGRLVIITFHSLEDRIVKNIFRQESRDCLCPPEQPTCTCSHATSVRVLTKKVVHPSDEEKKHNPASRSAKLRAIEKLT